jgi:hypothetical protein
VTTRANRRSSHRPPAGSPRWHRVRRRSAPARRGVRLRRPVRGERVSGLRRSFSVPPGTGIEPSASSLSPSRWIADVARAASATLSRNTTRLDPVAAETLLALDSVPAPGPCTLEPAVRHRRSGQHRGQHERDVGSAVRGTIQDACGYRAALGMATVGRI